MSGGASIVVTAGIHAGASVVLSEGHALTIGSGNDTDLMLVDEHVEAHHVTINLSGELLVLIALQAGVSVFGYPLQPNRRVVLRSGGWFSMGAATLQFNGANGTAADAARHAELAWLFAHAPLAYVAKRWATAPRYMKLALVIVALFVAAWNGWKMFGSQSAPPATAHRDNPALQNVRMHLDPRSKVPVYEGYVQSVSDLAALTASARGKTRTFVMHVVVIEQLQEQVASFLEKYYRGAEIHASEPGSFVVTPPFSGEYLSADSWDYARVARLAHNGIDGLRALSFAGHDITTNSAVRVPLESIGLNLVHSPHAAWLADRQGGRYFPGALLPTGRLKSLSDCAATIVREDGTVYEFFTSGTHGGKGC